MTVPGARATTITAPERLERFDRLERVVHWASAVLLLVLLATAAVLYLGPLSVLVGHRPLVRSVHVTAGLALPLPFLMGVLGRHGAGLRADVRRLDRWDRQDRGWFRFRDPWRRHGLALGKFNPGQKLNAAFVAGSVVVMLATGSIMKWYGPFPDAWRTGATFAHDWIAISLGVAITAHIWLALHDREALRGMARGFVSARWARSKAPRWYEEVTGEPAAERARSGRPAAARGGATHRGPGGAPS